MSTRIAGEAALHKITSGRPVKLDAASVEAIEQASFALLDYLARLLAGKRVSPLALFPQYRAVQDLAGADRIHPADLWPNDWQWRDLPVEASVPRHADPALRDDVEAQTLILMRQGGSAPALALSDLCAGLAAGTPANQKHLATLWQMAAAFFEAQSQKLLKPDVYSKRIASRLLAQLLISERDPGAAGATEVLLLASVAAFAWGALRTVHVVTLVLESFGADAAITVEFIEIVDSFLIATAIFIFTVSLYALFIGDINVPEWMLAHDLYELKTKLSSMIVLVMAVKFLQKLIETKDANELLLRGLATAVVSAVLIAFGYFGKKD